MSKWIVPLDSSNKPTQFPTCLPEDTDVETTARAMGFAANSGFIVIAGLTLPSGITTDVFTMEFTTISDTSSLASGRGYRLGFGTSFTDNNLKVDITNITRLSEAIEIF